MKKEDKKNMLWKSTKSTNQQKEELLYGNVDQLTEKEKKEQKKKMITEQLQ